MKKLAVLFFAFICTISGFSQNSGLFGKKNLVDLDVTIYTPLIGSRFNENRRFYVPSTGGFTEKKDWIDCAYSLNYVRSVGKKTSLSFEVGYQKIDAKTDGYYSKSFYDSTYGYYEDKSFIGIVENFKFSHFYFIPKLEFTQKNGIFGMGINHQIGIGFGRSSLIQKDYAFSLSEYYYSGSSTPDYEADFRANMFDYSKKKFKNMIFLYALNFRKPLSRNLLINYGFRYTLNIVHRSVETITDTNNSKYWISKSDALDILRDERFSNIVQFKIGMSYVF